MRSPCKASPSIAGAEVGTQPKAKIQLELTLFFMLITKFLNKIYSLTTSLATVLCVFFITCVFAQSPSAVLFSLSTTKGIKTTM